MKKVAIKTGKKSLKDFIIEVSIGEIGEIKDKHPYLAFSLVCEGIEFLGKIISNDSWEKLNKSEEHFVGALNRFKALKQYHPADETYIKNGKSKEYSSLFRTVRCGFCHGLRPSTTDKKDNQYRCYLGEYNNTYSSTEGEKKILYYNINQLYNDFVSACNELIEHPDYVGAEKSLDDDFLVYHRIYDIDTT